MYDYDRTKKAVGKDVLVPIEPTDPYREIAKRMVLHAADGKTVRLSPRTSPKYGDYVFWFDEGRQVFQALIEGRPVGDLNGKQLAIKVVEAWAEDLR